MSAANSSTGCQEFLKETRYASPANLLISIQSFSLFSKSVIDKYESRSFESGGYQWKLIIYPNGYNGECNSLSVHFSIADSDSLPVGWEVNAVFAFFIHNQIKDNYVCFRGVTRRFNAVIQRWGFSKLISKETLMNPTNGYVVGDNCVFGAEVLVIKSKRVNECLRLVKDAASIKREWKIPNFSKLGDIWRSEEFDVGECKWKVKLHPKGQHTLPKNEYMSLFLVLKSLPPHQRVKAEVLMSIKTNDSSFSKKYTHWFKNSSEDWGFSKFISLADIRAKGFLADDCCFLEIEITVQAIVREALEF
ncbi:hypothetical protein SASPL_116397 [Salvia splendens]|uniref:MATH domain-containing protein n=1 Tax=Salvia splendens TaxID=180675 RepID=A0A8X8XXE1_SALSN|nr:uncharacterized protein LOC121807600 [Salvia splendens]KAG6419885.1 hypothetical protein SASPL_116397 [Salvia splendens]